jgi:hypothetical protein
MIRLLSASVLCAGLSACASAPPQPPPIAAPPPGEPPGIAGLSAQKLRIAFGAPQFVRKDGDSELWRYDGEACKAFFFLYPQSGTLAVRHVETVPRGAAMAADITCLDALRARAHAVS